MKKVLVIEVLYVVLACVLLEAFMLAVWAESFTWVMVNTVLLGALTLQVSSHINKRINIKKQEAEFGKLASK